MEGMTALRRQKDPLALLVKGWKSHFGMYRGLALAQSQNRFREVPGYIPANSGTSHNQPCIGPVAV